MIGELTMEAYVLKYSGRLILKEGFTAKLKRAIRSFLSAEAGENENLKEISGTSAKERIAEEAGRMLDQYGDSILRLAYSYLHNMSDAEDIVQETLIKYMKAGPEFENSNHEKAWLLKVAANLSKNKIEYNKVRMADELDEKLADEEREDLSFVWDAVKNLPDNMREVIHLFYHEGYSTKEISSILRRNESTVRSDLKRGRDKLRIMLKEVYDFEKI